MSMTIDEFRAAARGRKIYVYSTNLEGTGYAKRFLSMGLDVGGFIDTRKFRNGQKCGIPVIHPNAFFGSLVHGSLVIIAAKHRPTRRMAIDRCKQSGLLRKKTFFSATDLCDYFPTIEVAGKCNLKCITCNMGIPGANARGGYMTKVAYRQVLEKLKQDIPFLNSVYLYTWGEPLLNPELGDIIRISSELGVACEVSTNLASAERRIENMIKANPDVLVIPCSGTGAMFEATRTGAKWPIFRKNLFKLREYINHHEAETAVRVHYHIYKDNLETDFDDIAQLCEELGFQFQPMVAQVFPEYVLRRELYGEPIPKEMLEADKLLYFSLEQQLGYARKVKDKSCFMVKVFPQIRWDRAVLHCCNLSFPVLHEDYLNTSLNEVLQERERNQFCSQCMKHAMHRYFDVAVSVNTVDGKRVITRD